ncbi:nucleotidyltransferase [Enterococcus plantarum]|uniref:Nucleotidyltransferase n=1 Tax=Enterococcus plantarum TaxID=1077675 RepID=A0A2W3Z4C0_9ENTE|nr:nucleotidyltransferase [Enterococcus plantarum]PZL72160.1 nucleotidyltransferase [Enterococcus plantarum]
MEFNNEMLISYSKPLSFTEENRCKNAIQMISTALKNEGYSETEGITLSFSDTYAYETRLKKGSREIKLLVQGSYANKTNVKASSDVDVAVIQENVFNTNYRAGVTDKNYGFSSSAYRSDQYKKDIYDDLISYFGPGSVEWNNKCLSIEGNSYRTDSDAVPARRNRDYRGDYRMDSTNYVGGIRIVPDKGEPIVNYPEQHIENGRNKNNSTNHYFKKNVRIIKKIRYLMKDARISSADNVSSFMLESLLWNIPDYLFTTEADYLKKFEGILNYIKNSSSWDEYKEANGIKPLCGTAQEKSNLIQFITDLNNFFEPVY